jgi:hypothetical protein
VFEELEDGGFSALPLTEVINSEKGMDDAQALVEVVAGTGTVKVRKAPKALAPPKTTEKLRSRLNTLAILLQVAAYKHSTRLWLKTTSQELWRKYTEHILGELVAGYKTLVGGQEFSASWETVLSYEYNIRKLACKKVLYDDLDLAAALKEAMEDLQIKERFFITPTAIAAGANSRYGSSSSGQHNVPPRPAPYADPKGGKDKGGKGGDKGPKGGKGKGGKGKGGKQVTSNESRKIGRQMKTPDGRLICHRFQSKECSYGDNCRFVHVCSKC